MYCAQCRNASCGRNVHLPALFLSPSNISFRRVRSKSSSICMRQPVRSDGSSSNAWSAESLGFLEIGQILGAHGVKGEVRVRTSTNFNELRLKSSAIRYLLLPGRIYPRPLQITNSRRASKQGQWILKLQDRSLSREQSALLRGAKLYVKKTGPASELPSLKSGEFHVPDLIGMQVVLQEGDTAELDTDAEEATKFSHVGIVKSVITRDEICAASGAGRGAAAVANDILEVALVSWSQHKQIPDANAERNRTAPSKVDLNYLENAQCVLIPFVNQIVPVVDMSNRRMIIDPPQGLLDITLVNRKEKPRRPRALLMPAPPASSSPT